MLFVTLCNSKEGGTMQERLARRLSWNVPQGVRPIAEYWLQTEKPAVVMISEAETIAPIMQGVSEWDDLLEISVFPAVSVEEGMKLARSMQERELVQA